VHPLHQFFETQFVLQEPSYSSIYPPGQGLVLAAGWMLFGSPWAGVLLATAALCALCYWMLRAWVTPGWALAGGVLAVIEFGPLNQWMNSYWGGAAAAAAGCLVFGALPRLIERARPRDAVLLSAGFGLHLLIRPYESIFLALSVLLFLALVGRTLGPRGSPWTRSSLGATGPTGASAADQGVRPTGRWRLPAKLALTAALALLPAIVLLLLQNRQVTGQWLTLPYSASQYQYGVPSGFTFQSPPIPHRDLNREQALNYRMQLSFRQTAGETVKSYLERLEYRIRYYRFFFLAPLYLALPGFLCAMRQRRFLWVGLTLAAFALGSNFYPNFEPHYIAAVTCLFVLAALVGLQKWERFSRDAAHLIAFLCVAAFIFWYSMHLFDTQEFSLSVRQYETWDGLNHRNPAARIAVNQQLAAMPGKLLVFVRYYPQHIFQEEWVYNRADIDSSRVVWARDLGADENEKLRAYYKDRSVWLLEPDFRPPRLRPYQ
jgi:hypothetical protein